MSYPDKAREKMCGRCHSITECKRLEKDEVVPIYMVDGPHGAYIRYMAFRGLYHVCDKCTVELLRKAADVLENSIGKPNKITKYF